MLTWMEDSRRGKSTSGMKVSIESDVEVENTQFLHLDLNRENEPIKTYASISLSLFVFRIGS